MSAQVRRAILHEPDVGGHKQVDDFFPGKQGNPLLTTNNLKQHKRAELI